MTEERNKSAKEVEEIWARVVAVGVEALHDALERGEDDAGIVGAVYDAMVEKHTAELRERSFCLSAEAS